MDVTNNEAVLETFCSKLPERVLFDLENKRAHGGGAAWTLPTILQSLTENLNLREAVHERTSKVASASNFQSAKSTNSSKNTSAGRSTAEVLAVNSKAKSNNFPACAFCNGAHYSDKCKQCSTLDERKARASELRLCFVCLKEGHTFRNCRDAKLCFYCKRTGHHDRALCPRKFGVRIAQKNPQQVATTAVTDTSQQSASLATASLNSTPMLYTPGQTVLLYMALAYVKNPTNNKIFPARLVLDTGSHRTFITRKLAEKLQLASEGSETLSIMAFAAETTRDLDSYRVCFELCLRDGTFMPMYANAMSVITGSLQRQRLGADDLQALRYFSPDDLADEMLDRLELVLPDILVGMDYYAKLLLDEKRKRLPSGLDLVPSKLGLIIGGSQKEGVHCAVDHKIQALYVMTQHNQSVPCLNLFSHADATVTQTPNLEDFWNLETIGISDSPHVNDDDLAVERFNETIRFEGGRYYVTWPWKPDTFVLPDNFGLAMGRFKTLTKRFQSDPDLLCKYDAIMQDQRAKGIIEPVNTLSSGNSEKNRVHYLPHHPVITPAKTTTKVRIVLDGSSKAKKGANSLNECMYRGPIILPDLVGLLCHFCLGHIAVIADIEKAFLQIGLQPTERDVTRFLWYKDPTKPVVENNLQIYRFCRVTFGVISSPFLLEATVKFHLQSEGTPVALLIADNVYMDNLLASVETVEEAYNIYKEGKSIFAKALMNLHEWTSNSTEFNALLSESDHVKSTKQKVLGLSWDLSTDSISISSTPSLTTTVPTKRQILQTVASIFDPLGLFSPVTLHGKLFLQELWKCDVTWDEEISPHLLEKWTEIFELLSVIPTISVPRTLGFSADCTFQLLVFCDASAKAYAAVVYLKCERNGASQIQLMYSKSRLAPVDTKTKKKVSLPRLELLGLLIGVRAANFIKRELKLPIQKRFVWTDAQCVLRWLTCKKPLSVFVENHLKEIRKEDDICFSYVPSEENPADFATRGLTAPELADNFLWWKGPTWISKCESDWPKQDLPDVTPDILEQFDAETKGPKSAYEASCITNVAPCEETICFFSDTANSKTSQASVFGIDSQRFSSVQKLLRTTVYCLRFLKRISRTKVAVSTLREINMCGAVTLSELKCAQLLWEKSAQRAHFGEVFSALKNGSFHNLQSQLDLHVDENGLLRCYGRLQKADLDLGAKMPILLPRNDYFTELIIRDIHGRLIHVGVGHTLAQIRQTYWIPQGRVEVRKVLKQCILCRKYGGGPFQLPKMPIWPKEHVSRSEPFQFTGLDYLGPLLIKSAQKEPAKVWVCLFTCLAVRAIHLELVGDLTTEQFLGCLRRFIARRGRPQQIISDNAPHFKLAASVLEKAWRTVLHDADVLNYCSANEISWHFTTELAPWQGGFYERLVGLVKQSLRKCLGKTLLSYDQLETLLVEIEAVVNSRPLTFIYGDIDSQRSLTAADFLLPKRDFGVPNLEHNLDDPDFQPKLSSKDALIGLWKQRQKQLDAFWKFWHDEYLLSLRERPQLRHKGSRVHVNSTPKVGEIVLIKEDGVQRGCWKMGRIVEVILSKDGEIRSAKILLPSQHIINRTVNFIFPLEIAATEEINPENSLPPPAQLEEETSSAPGRPTRQAANRARENIQRWLSSCAATVLFAPNLDFT